jgi:hypothetical protein
MVVGGRPLDLTMDEVVNLMHDVPPEPIREHIVEIADTSYPPKQALAQVTGWGRHSFTSMEAIRVFSRLGFLCHRAGRNPDGRTAWIPANPSVLDEENSSSGLRHIGRMATEGQSRCLEQGFWVALRLRPGAAPRRSYLGEVRATDEHGVRITLAGQPVGAAVSHDVYVPWGIVELAYVATSEDQMADSDLGAWQEELGQD